jgi:hypothetical protein
MPPKFRGANVLIGIIANDAARFSEFGASVTNLQVPPGNRIEWVIGGDWCGARNSLAQLCIDEQYTHLWFMDDDHSFAPDILMKLLRHDQPLVNPICFTRTWPFQPVTYVEEGALDLASVPDRGLVVLHAGGCAGMLIRREVLEAIEPPWFEYSDKSEDVIFCEKAKAAGFQLYGDLEARLGHITTAVVWPSFNPEHGWMTGLTIGKDMQVQIPLTGDLLNHNIKRIEVPFDADVPIEEPGEHYGPGGYMEREDNPAVALAVVETPSGPPEPHDFRERCLICGSPATWHDIHDQWGCETHFPDSDAWRTYYERAEIWFTLDLRDGAGDHRWYFRLLRGDGTIAFVNERGFTQEADCINEIESRHPGLPVHQIESELDDSRRERTGPPLRLWDRGAR